MKKVVLVWLLLPVAALAQSAFDGTWKQRLDSIKITGKPEVFSIVDGTYICSSCPRELKIMADGQDHPVAGVPNFTLAVTIVDAHTTRNTWKYAGKITDVTTITVSADGSTINGASTQYDGAEPTSGTWTEKRVAAGPPGSHAVSGSWQMDRITGGNDAQTIVSYAMSADGFRMKAMNGWGYDAKFDGKEYPLVGGDPWHATVTLQRIDDHTVQETDRSSKGKVVEEIRLVAAKDGKTIKVEDHDLIGGLAGEQTTTYTLDKQ
ncbi:MAG TPA: hypothetical protein VIX19_08080 [Terriglobales bacterium]